MLKWIFKVALFACIWPSFVLSQIHYEMETYRDSSSFISGDYGKNWQTNWIPQHRYKSYLFGNNIDLQEEITSLSKATSKDFLTAELNENFKISYLSKQRRDKQISIDLEQKVNFQSVLKRNLITALLEGWDKFDSINASGTFAQIFHSTKISAGMRTSYCRDTANWFIHPKLNFYIPYQWLQLNIQQGAFAIDQNPFTTLSADINMIMAQKGLDSNLFTPIGFGAGIDVEVAKIIEKKLLISAQLRDFGWISIPVIEFITIKGNAEFSGFDILADSTSNLTESILDTFNLERSNMALSWRNDARIIVSLINKFNKGWFYKISVTHFMNYPRGAILQMAINKQICNHFFLETGLVFGGLGDPLWNTGIHFSGKHWRFGLNTSNLLLDRANSFAGNAFIAKLF